MNMILIILYVLHFFNDGIRTVFLSLLPFIAKELHLSFTQVGFLGASLGAIAAIFSIPAGYLALQIGGFRILFFALLIYSFGAIGLGFAPNFIVIAVLFYSASVGFGVFHTIANILVARSIDKAQLGRRMGDFAALGDTGRVLMPIAAIFIVSHFGWREAFFAVAGLGLIVYLFRWILPLKEHIVHVKTKKSNVSYGEWLRELPFFFRQRKLLLVIAAGMIDNLASNPIFVFLPFLLLGRGFSTGMLGIFIAAFFIGSLFGKFFFGRGVDIFGSRKVFIGAELSMAITLLVLTVSYNFFLLLGISLLLGAFTRGTLPVISTLFAKVVHEDHYEKVFAISETMSGIGITIAPIIAGLIADTFGVVVFFYCAAFFAVAATLPIFALLRDSSLKEQMILSEEKAAIFDK